MLQHFLNYLKSSTYIYFINKQGSLFLSFISNFKYFDLAVRFCFTKRHRYKCFALVFILYVFTDILYIIYEKNYKKKMDCFAC